MENNIYKEMIEESPIPYIHIKIIEDENGNYKSLEVKNFNKAYERTFLIDQDKNLIEINEILRDKDSVKEWRKFLSDVKENRKGTIKKYIKHIQAYYQIDGFYGDNDEFHIRLNKLPYTSENITSENYVMDTSITEQVDLRKKLEIVEKRFLDIMNNINDVIIIRDEKKAHYINPAFERIYKFKPDELYEDMNKWYEHWDEVQFEENTPKYSYDEEDSCTFKVSKKGQEDIWIWSRFVPIMDSEGNLQKKIGILSDITETKKMQLEMDKIKMDFLANISHELRTPINLILSTIQLLCIKLDKLDVETLEYFEKYMGIIAQNGTRLLRLVNNLIDTTRVEAGCFNYSPKNSNIVSCVEDICLSISTFVNSNDIDIIFDTDEEEKIIAFDQDIMERIILNLVSNAIKFNKPNGKIEITISCKDDVQIRVKDTGIGIPKEKLENVFGRFEQVKTKFKKEREGSGIGLSLVKSLVEMHKGNIKVKSKLGEGSEFIITLPDKLIEIDDENIIETPPQFLNETHRLDVEFSDIYL